MLISGSTPRKIRRALRLSPLQRIFRMLRRRGIKTNELHALEVFASTGDIHLKDYARSVARLDAWELSEQNAAELRRNVPNATVRCGDSYELIKTEPGRFGLIVVDNPLSQHGGHSEHFDLFPHILRISDNDCILIINAVTSIHHCHSAEIEKHLRNPSFLARRRQFYGTDHPEEISKSQMIDVYRTHFDAQGFDLSWHVFWRRTWTYRIYHLILCIHRRAGGSSEVKPR